ncbi:MAG: nucleotidyltransferase domain-containing protein [Candidatus Omnitrophica bacterium]|nr:nucleotidyltransferase domain-containing protein [Candidatus Omnitrophota bacterium]
MLKKVDKILKIARQDDEILAVFLFGSLARREGHKTSDIDICLILKPGRYSSLGLSEKRFEYLKVFDLDVQIFQQLPLYIKMRVIKDGKKLFCANEDELYQSVFNTITEFEDYRDIYRDYLMEVGNVR